MAAGVLDCVSTIPSMMCERTRSPTLASILLGGRTIETIRLYLRRFGSM